MDWLTFQAHLQALSSSEQDRIWRAYDLAQKMHGDQKRKSGEPYFNHPVTVATMLVDMGADGDTIVSALLHDTVEDTPLTLAEIEREFSPAVASLVEGVTKLSAADVAESPTLNEQTETLRKIFTLMQKDVRIMIIKLVDRLHNMQTIRFLKPERQLALAQETADVYVKIADRLCMQDLRDELQMLCVAVLEPELFNELKEMSAQALRESEEVAERMRQHLRQTGKIGHGTTVLPEQTSWDNLQKQRLDKGSSGAHAAVVIVCENLDECYGLLGLLHQLWQRQRLTFEDYINSPLLNGYRGLHTTVILKDGVRVRCKIRTKEMQLYARKGVTMECFGAKSSGVLDALPWTKRISPLAQGTAHRSDEFWESLQSDILGESIVVHSPGDEAVQVPLVASALDGAFYMFLDDALHLETLSVNGKDVPFDHPLEHGDSLSVTLASQPTVRRQWLDWVKTGIATTKIRQELSKAPVPEKEMVGQALLEKVARREGRPGLAELQANRLQESLSRLGVGSLSELYVMIAEGKLDASHVSATLFPSSARRAAQLLHWKLAVKLPGTTSLPDNLSNSLQSAAPLRTNSRITGRGLNYRANFLLTREQAQSLESTLQHRLPRGTWTLVAAHKQLWLSLTTVTLIILWGLDPVLAHALLRFAGMDAFQLTLIRFLAFFGFSMIAYVSQTSFSPHTFKPLSPLRSSLLLSGAALFVTGLSSYISLSTIPPTQYILFIIGGLTLGSLIRSLRAHRPAIFLAGLLFILTACAVTLIIMQGSSALGLFCAALSAAGFGVYSLASRRYQQETTIRSRYPAFLFWVSAVGMILSLGLVPFVNFSALGIWQILAAVSFVAVFSVLPYILFFECMRYTDSNALDQLLAFVCLSTIIGETLVTHSWVPLLVSPACIFIALQLALRHRPADVSLA